MSALLLLLLLTGGFWSAAASAMEEVVPCVHPSAGNLSFGFLPAAECEEILFHLDDLVATAQICRTTGNCAPAMMADCTQRDCYSHFAESALKLADVILDSQQEGRRLTCRLGTTRVVTHWWTDTNCQRAQDAYRYCLSQFLQVRACVAYALRRGTLHGPMGELEWAIYLLAQRLPTNGDLDAPLAKAILALEELQEAYTATHEAGHAIRFRGDL